jgi:2-polyprenyl-3-methyl-5-hydroxy-6-metoxy-1,4-benzoquinol methylase
MLFPFYFRGRIHELTIKSSISAGLRRLHLLNAAESVRYYLEKIKYYKTNRVFRKRHPDVVMPPEYFIYETYKLNVEEYYYDGQETAKEIVTALAMDSGLSQPGSRILDWGCGPGRIVRHLPALLPQAAIYGTDYNEKYIGWCSNELKGIRFTLNHIDPPLNYADSFFDAIIGFSIFTHLSEKNHFAWINELHRVIKTGGTAFITTQGRAYRVKLLAAEQALFDKGALVSRENVREGNRLFSAFQPPEFMRQLMAGKFEVIEFIPAPLNHHQPVQDSWLIRKIT